MMTLAGVELETLVSEPDALTTRPPLLFKQKKNENSIKIVKSTEVNKKTA